MREVEVTRFVAASPREVARVLTPRVVIDAEGSFDVRDVGQVDGGTLVTAARAGLQLQFLFEERDDGLAYEQVEGPLETLRTTISTRAKNEGTELRAVSAVAVGGPGVLDRLAAWKRRGELRRALAGIEERC